MAVTINKAPVTQEELGIVLLVNAFSQTKFKNFGKFVNQTLSKLIEKGLAEAEKGTVALTDKAQTVIDCIESEQKVHDFPALAQKMRELFPAGSQPGTGYLWRCSTSQVIERLQVLIKKKGDTFTDDEAIAATKAYVESYKGDRKIRTLKYFIFKNEVRGGKEEMDSDLLDYIDNIRDGEQTQQEETTISNFL